MAAILAPADQSNTTSVKWPVVFYASRPQAQDRSVIKALQCYDEACDRSTSHSVLDVGDVGYQLTAATVQRTYSTDSFAPPYLAFFAQTAALGYDLQVLRCLDFVCSKHVLISSFPTGVVSNVNFLDISLELTTDASPLVSFSLNNGGPSGDVFQLCFLSCLLGSNGTDCVDPNRLNTCNATSKLPKTSGLRYR